LVIAAGMVGTVAFAHLADRPDTPISNLYLGSAAAPTPAAACTASAVSWPPRRAGRAQPGGWLRRRVPSAALDLVHGALVLGRAGLRPSSAG